jgi:hypothetical protein
VSCYGYRIFDEEPDMIEFNGRVPDKRDVSPYGMAPRTCIV